MSTGDMKGVLDRAATSPDPVIRGIGIEYVKALQTADRLRPFLEVYASGLSVLSISSSSMAEIETESVSQTNPIVKGKEFAARVVAILQEHGKPAHFQKLYDLYVARHGNDVTSGTFRQKLVRFECAKKLHAVDGRGYWPKEDPIPDVN